MKSPDRDDHAPPKTARAEVPPKAPPKPRGPRTAKQIAAAETLGREQGQWMKEQAVLRQNAKDAAARADTNHMLQAAKIAYLKEPVYGRPNPAPQANPGPVPSVVPPADQGDVPSPPRAELQPQPGPSHADAPAGPPSSPTPHAGTPDIPPQPQRPAPDPTGPVTPPARSQILDPRVDPVSYHDAMMRMAPHTYAQYVTKDPVTGVSEWVAAKHLAYIGRRVAQGIARGDARIIVNLPPRFGKSELISHWTPLWALDNNPKIRAGVFSYDMKLALKFGRACRDSALERPLVRVDIKEDAEAAGYWRTKQGGGMYCSSVGSGVIGHRFELILCDDLCKDFASAVSPADQLTFRNWWEFSLMTRREPGASVIILGHRFATNDPCGWILENDPHTWEVITLPAIAVAGDPMGRQAGESLWPERWPVSLLEEMKKKISWESMYQQNPQSEMGDRVYDHFQQAVNVVPNGERGEMKLRVGQEETIALMLDFNINPGMHAGVGQYDNNRDEGYIDTEFHGERWRTEHVMREFISWCGSYGFKGPGTFPWKHVGIYGDRSGRNESTVTSQTDYGLIMKMLEGAGIPYKIIVPFKNPPVNDRVLTVNEALCDMGGVPHMFINKRCKRLLNDMNNQPRDEDGQPDKTDNSMGHAGDFLGYWCVWVRPVRQVQFQPAKVAYG